MPVTKPPEPPYLPLFSPPLRPIHRLQSSVLRTPSRQHTQCQSQPHNPSSTTTPQETAVGGTPTLMNPISVDFSRKHCRQILRPYLRMRPAVWVHTRLYRRVGTVSYSSFPRTLTPFSTATEPSGPITVKKMGNGEEVRGGERTRTDCPSRTCAGASTRLSRET